MLKGKVAVVTGGAQGIGQEICRKLLENNAKVALCDINEELGKNTVDLLRQIYSKCDCCFFSVDVSNKIQFEEFGSLLESISFPSSDLLREKEDVSNCYNLKD